MRIALHRHPASAVSSEAAEDILRAVPGGKLVHLGQPAVGMMSNYFRALPAYRRELQKNELDAAEAAGVDALVAVYHADHRELCAHERDHPFRIMNMLEIVGASMGLHHDDQFKRLKLLQDGDAIAADCEDSDRAAWSRPAPPPGWRSRPCWRSSRCRCAARAPQRPTEPAAIEWARRALPRRAVPNYVQQRPVMASATRSSSLSAACASACGCACASGGGTPGSAIG